MKRFLVFAGDNWYPFGGWKDFKESFDTLHEAQNYLMDSSSYDWYHIVDSSTGEIVEKGEVK